MSRTSRFLRIALPFLLTLALASCSASVSSILSTVFQLDPNELTALTLRVNDQSWPVTPVFHPETMDYLVQLPPETSSATLVGDFRGTEPYFSLITGLAADETTPLSITTVDGGLLISGLQTGENTLTFKLPSPDDSDPTYTLVLDVIQVVGLAQLSFEEGTGIHATIGIDPPSRQGFTLLYKITANGQTNLALHVAPENQQGRIVVPAGVARHPLRIPTLDNDRDEGERSEVTVKLIGIESTEGYTINPDRNAAYVTLEDNDSTEVFIGFSASSIAEDGNSVMVFFEMPHALSEDVQVEFRVRGLASPYLPASVVEGQQGTHFLTIPASKNVANLLVRVEPDDREIFLAQGFEVDLVSVSSASSQVVVGQPSRVKVTPIAENRDGDSSEN
ncbi:MAG: hypothetical protein MI717_00450 [Spirochaetales bacterium]|nr:hypothetical protein [Spirochaetales bacterium]